jgi:hypothetical protein
MQALCDLNHCSSSQILLFFMQIFFIFSLEMFYQKSECTCIFNIVSPLTFNGFLAQIRRLNSEVFEGEAYITEVYIALLHPQSFKDNLIQYLRDSGYT